MSNAAVDKARNEIVLALLKRTAVPTAPRYQAEPEVRETPRAPVRVQNRDLEAAIDDMIDRFPTTLEYLAK